MFDFIPASVTPPAPSRATRNVVTRSKGSVRGELLAKTPADQFLRKFVYESMLEKRFLLITLLDPRIQNIWDQPPAVPYRDAKGSIRHHTFDYLILTKAGEKIAVAVKSANAVKHRRFDLELKQISRHVPRRFANVIDLFTEYSFTWVEARNAERLQHFRWRIDVEADDHATKIVNDLQGGTPIQDLVERIGLGGRGYGAVMRQIAERRLRCAEHGLIDEEAIVVRGDA